MQDYSVEKPKKGFINMNESVLIVEDEFSIALDLELCLTQAGFHVIEIADSLDKCKQILMNFKPDIVLMDINIHGTFSGIDAAKWINVHFDIPIVFLSALSDEKTLEQVLETDAFGYLTKPYKEKDLIHTLKIALRNHKFLKEINKKETIHTQITQIEANTLKYNENLFIKERNKLISITLSDVYFLEALENYTQIYVHDKKWIVNSYLKDIESKLPSEFLRVHRSYIINLNKIQKIEDNFITIETNNIPIGRSFKNELLKKIKII